MYIINKRECLIVEMKVYIVNLGKYNEGESVGAWFNLPINLDDVRE